MNSLISNNKEWTMQVSIRNDLCALFILMVIFIIASLMTGCNPSEPTEDSVKSNNNSEGGSHSNETLLEINEYKKLICRDSVIRKSIGEKVHTCITFTLLNEPCLENKTDSSTKHFRVTHYTVDTITTNSLFFNGTCWVKKQKTISTKNSWLGYLYFKTNNIKYAIKIEPALEEDFLERVLFLEKLSTRFPPEEAHMNFEMWVIELLKDGEYLTYEITDMGLDQNIEAEILKYSSF